MKPLSLSASNICAIAVEHFADHGYDASSLNEIAVRAGMRKASLYAHFVSKDALFLTVFGIALDHEHRYICLLYTSPSPRDRQKSRMPSSA